MTYSLNDFYRRVKELAAEYEETYCHTEVARSNEGLRFKAYINNFSWVDGITPDSCIKQLREIKNPTDIEIDINIEKEEDEPT